jgi:dTDP-glucose 4,6-dehydratase
MRLLLTGAAGFIGSNFARRIADESFSGFESVIVLDKLTYAGVPVNLKIAHKINNYKFFEGDICNSDLVSRVINEVDAVINFAAESHVDRSIGSAAEFIETNVKGVQTLMDAIRVSKRKIRFIQVSTDEVYGSIDSGSWTEDSPLKPNSPYSASKASGELIARSYNRTHDLDVVITRCSNNYGTHHFPEKLIPLFITNILEGKKLPIYGNGNNVRDWLHVDDHCRGIYQVLMNGKSGEVYNIGGGRELSNLEITSYILKIMNVDESQIVYVEDRKGHDQRYSIDWSKINRELGYVPEVDFESGLRETINWFKNNEEWWKPLKHRVGL